METFGAEPGRATLIGTLTSADPLPAVDGVGCVEVRADLMGEVDLEALRAWFPGKLLFTLRSKAEGGRFEGAGERRRKRLIAAAKSYDFVDLEAMRDLTPEVLRSIPPEKRLVSWHGPATDAEGLKAIFSRMTAVQAPLYKLVPTATQSGEELAPLVFLHGLQRRDVAAFAVGETGAWTRLVAPRLGAPVVYGALGHTPAAPGQLGIRPLQEDYGLPFLRPVDVLFGIVGKPVAHSLSPRIHNTAYRELGIPALYVPFHAEQFGDFWLEVVESGVLEEIGMPLKGLSVTTPFKEAALAVAGAESPLASTIGAANTLVWNQGVWEAEATDPDGVVLPLKERGVELAGKEVAVVGAGGAGRSAAVGLANAGAQVTLFNRTEERGRSAAERLGLPFVLLAELDPGRFDVLVNATALGRDDREALPFDPGAVRPEAVVIDLVYRLNGPTPLLAAVAARGAVAVDGREVLVDQARAQFRMMTGQELPLALTRQMVGLEDAAA